MKHVFFRRILLTYIILAPLLLISLEFYLSREVKDSYIANLKDSLIIQARLIADQIPPSFATNLDDFCKTFKEKAGARITIIDSSGKVLGDSDQFSGSMENHLNRPEIQAADISNIGSSIRFSKTISRDLFYLAIAVNQDSNKRFVRLSLPLHDVEAAVNTVRIRIIIVSLAAFLLIVVIGLVQSRKVAKSLEEITSFSKEIAAGNLKKRLFVKERDEFVELGRNISDMAQELSARIQQSEEEKDKIEAILKNMSDGLILTDAKGVILLGNSAIRNLFAIQSDIEGKTLTESLRNAELMEIVESIVSGREKISREIRINRPRELYLMVTATPYYSAHPSREVCGVVLTFHDITRLKKLEEIRKDFVANVSHEIKTPITAIKGFAETLIEGALDDRDNARKFLLTIKQNSERINSIVDDLLTLSRIELGDIKIEKEVVNLEEIVDTVFTTLKEKADRKNLYLKKKIAPETLELRADRNRLIQILLNLVDNGIKFTESGGVTVRVKNEKSKAAGEEEKNFMEILIEDTGIGIPRKHLSRLGERFYRVDRARSRELGGTGLGLAIVKHLVKAHGWEMKIEGTEGAGTIVRLICPVD